MELSILNRLKKLWDVWDIPTCILLSLLLQVFLVLFASWRKRSSNSFLLFLIWSAYLSADWIAAVTVGLITKVLTNPFHPHVNEVLYAFWASFLLLHLGGPDTITSFATEDNEFWLRHLFSLILQVIGAGCCFLLTLPNNNLWIPTILVFVVGAVKYAERTMALYLASFDHFGAPVRDFGEPDGEGTEFVFSPTSESNHMELLMVSYSLFNRFKGIVVGFLPSPKVIKSSKKLFLQITTPNVGFKLIEYELSFMFEVLHTKVSVVRNRIGLILRLSSLFFVVGAFLAFHFVADKDDFGGFEMSLTYALLIGAIGVDAISGIKLLFSDLILVSNNGLIKRWRKYIPDYVLKRRRWCESVCQYNMIDYCLGERWLWNYSLPYCVRFMVEKIKIILFSTSEDEIEDLKCFIFGKLHRKKFTTRFHFHISPDDPIRFVDLSSELRYTEQVLQLHLITEIRYHQTQIESRNYAEAGKRSRRISKLISDYMFYLLVMKPELLGPSVVGINWQMTLEDTFTEAKRYLKKYQISDHVKACNQLSDYNDDHVDETDRRRSESLLSKACLRAKDLKLERHWKDLSTEWVEALCIGAMRCRPILHAQQPSRGGELFTFSWFLLNHLGGTQGTNGGDEESNVSDFTDMENETETGNNIQQSNASTS
ncbi:uncharacterized protein LOC107403261 [Ziziphus jujuba]|uniref:Uncharacterized protein LOC107403261 n=1 Tax=Ziziphus jujuba TaxID=326968 RepID=A0A6P4AQQ3_ZIZJJ|nr:uncharacterized protein LOC107403261 [Ziziphus jujuba]